MIFYDFILNSYDDKQINCSDFKNKMTIVVNVASNCGLSNSSYSKMKEIKNKYKNEIIFILCPCDQFLNQEFKNIKEVEIFIKEIFEIKNKLENEGIFLTKAINLKGKEIDPLFNFLINEKKGWFGNSIKWNFTSFLINKEGKVIERFSPTNFITIQDIENILFKNNM